MFRVNREDNRLVPLEERSFSELQLRERDHLQEWIAGTPKALGGEELLILQKEFDGFEDTNERLDLLALDKKKGLVVIEIKRDDSGRDVVWQALKYVAYCSTLTTRQIVDIYQKYLDRQPAGVNEDAEENLRAFLEVEELDDVVLNSGNEQRLVLIAANFRKEVTATVLWLIAKGVQAQCFRAVPYSSGEDTLVDLRQIIPTPEAADFMIKMAAKDSEEKITQGVQRDSHARNLEFWTQALEELQTRDVSLFANISPLKEPWLRSAAGVSGCGYYLILLKKGARVEVYLRRPEKKENKWIFDQLAREKETLEHSFGNKLNWQRLDGKTASRISLFCPFDGYNRDVWPEMIDWMCEHIVRLEEAFSEPLTGLKQQLISGIDSSARERSKQSKAN